MVYLIFSTESLGQFNLRRIQGCIQYIFRAGGKAQAVSRKETCVFLLMNADRTVHFVSQPRLVKYYRKLGFEDGLISQGVLYAVFVQVSWALLGVDVRVVFERLLATLLLMFCFNIAWPK